MIEHVGYVMYEVNDSDKFFRDLKDCIGVHQKRG